ncbi:MAG TPA: ATP-binding cassette domain-containing protein, partial [Candidatus Dormibacteraeota bacterium]
MSAEPADPGPRLRGATLATELLSAGYAGRAVVQEVSIRVAPGEVVSVVGPNGSGKSTLLKALVGVVQALSGHVLWEGTDVTNWTPDAAARAGVGYVPQVDDVFAPLSVRENL